MGQDQRIGDMLVASGLLDPADIPSIEARVQESGTRFASAAVDLGLLSEHEVLQFLARQHGVPAADLTRCVLPRTLLETIPADVATREEVLPLRIEDSNLMLAMATPSATAIRDEIAFVTGLSVLPYVALRDRLQATIHNAYRSSDDPYCGPRAELDRADERGFVAIVTEVPSATGADVEIEMEIQGADDLDDNEGPLELSSDELKSVEDDRPDFDHWVSAEAKTVVLIDDEPEILRLLLATIRQLDVNIVTAARGVDGLLKIKKHRPDLVVTDAMLPEVHGFEIVKKLKESRRFRDTPVLMISAIYRGWRIAEDIKDTYRVDAFLEKPFRVAELRHHVKQLLEASSEDAGTELPNHAPDRYAEGVDAYKNGRLTDAFSKLKEAESLEPFSSRIQFMLARVLERQERPLQSIYHYERAIELNPSMFAATKNLALLYQAKGFKNKAVEMWERSLRAAPNDQIRAQIKTHLVSIL